MTDRWREEIPAAGHRRRTLLKRAMPPVVVAALLLALGAVHLAILVLAATLIVSIATTMSPTTASKVDHALATMGRGAGRLVSTALLGVVHVLIIWPASGLAYLLRLNPVRASTLPRGDWQHRTAAAAPSWARTFSEEVSPPPSRTRQAVRAVPQILGALALLVLADYGLGRAWERNSGSETVVPPPTNVERLASASAPQGSWADAYWEEFGALRYDYAPFLLSRPADISGPHISVSNGVRATWQHPRAAPRPPVVWFLGGSATWGVGQRDEHTIPSQVARLAADAGQPIRAVNLGQPGHSSWQSALLLEQELAVRRPPDVIVLYDGAEDVAIQVERSTPVPSHYNVSGAELALVGRDSEAEQARDLWEDYQESSIVGGAVSWLQESLGFQEPAGAQGGPLAERVAGLHARSADLVRFLAADHGAGVVVAWQAAAGVDGDGGAFRDIEIPPEEWDLRDVLDGGAEPVFLDGVLTNEAGAAVAAGALWPLIRDALA